MRMVKLERDGDQALWSVADSFEMPRMDKSAVPEELSPLSTPRK
jgi:hypothetical protein